MVRLVEDGEVRCVTKATAQRAGMDDEGLDLTGTAGASDGGGSDDMRVAVCDADEELVLRRGGEASGRWDGSGGRR